MSLIWVQNFLGRLHPVFENLAGLPALVFLIVGLLTVIFTLGYLIKGSEVWWQLWGAVREIELLKREGLAPEPDEVSRILKTEPLQHLWEEYADTLHRLRKTPDTAGPVMEVRATVPAETFFTREVLVDGRLFDDFARHLPGVLTGLGIIGTFAGLLEGLKGFDPSTTSSAIAGLKPLLDGVRHAFVVSAAAITCAMYVVFVSRLVLAYFYGLVEKLSHAIDSLYSTGAGEEYLARLVQATEQGEGHAARLRDSLVEDLSRLMKNLSERQIQAYADNARQIGHSVGAALADPLRQLTDAIRHAGVAGTAASAVVPGTLRDSVATGLADSFAGQIRGIGEQLEYSTAAMTALQLALTQLSAELASSHASAAAQASGKVEAAIKEVSENQAQLMGRMRDLADGLRKFVAEEQHK